MPATVRPVQRLVMAVGSMYGHEELSLSAKVDGPVRRILHDVGDTVLPGELLLEIDPTDAELTVAEAQKSLELELAKLGSRNPLHMISESILAHRDASIHEGTTR